jgi:hypothetical protein
MTNSRSNMVLASEFVSLPMFPELTPAQLGIVVQGFKEAVAAGVIARIADKLNTALWL